MAVPRRISASIEDGDRRIRKRLLILGGAALLGAAAARTMKHAALRHERLRRGEIRELSDMWTWVDGLRWYTRFCAQRRDGRELPVVLVHGFGISSSYFVPTAERFATRYDVYAPDLPGHGKSETPREPLDVVSLADALHDWLVEMRMDRVRLVANSMGCQIAAELAARYPYKVDRLVLIGPTIDRDARSLVRVLPRFIAGGLRERMSMTLLLAKDYLRMGPRALPELHAMLAHPIEAVLPNVTAPVLLVRGEHDAIAPTRWLEELAQRTPDARVIVVPGAAHAAHYAAAEELLRLVGPFLDESGAQSAAAG